MPLSVSWEIVALAWVVLYNLLFIVPIALLAHTIDPTIRIFILFISTTVSLVAAAYLLRRNTLLYN